MAGKNWLTQQMRPGRTRGVKTLSNNPERASNSWPGYKAVGYAQRKVRTLMKRDRQNAQGTPADQFRLQTDGMSDNGASKGVTVKGHTESRAVTVGSPNPG